MSTTTQPSRRTVVAAMFEDRHAADAARAALESAAIVPAAIDIVDQPLAASGTPQPGLAQPEIAHHRRGIWDRVGSLLGAHPHAHGYAEGVARGHAMLFVHAAPDREAEVMKILNRHDPIDLMVREQAWAQTGWSGTYQAAPAAGTGSAAPRLLFADASYPDHLHATGLVNEDAPGSGVGAPLTNPMGIAVGGTPGVRRYTLPQ